MTEIPADENFREVCSDVVMRFKGHDAYGGRDAALKAFHRRAPGHEPADYENAFDNGCDIYDLALNAIVLFPAEDRTRNGYARSEDIDIEKCLRYIEELCPDGGEKMRSQILHGVIFWHYLK